MPVEFLCLPEWSPQSGPDGPKFSLPHAAFLPAVCGVLTEHLRRQHGWDGLQTHGARLIRHFCGDIKVSMSPLMTVCAIRVLFQSANWCEVLACPPSQVWNGFSDTS